MRAISHVAVGVSDMEQLLPFYRDLLGLKVSLDTAENHQAGISAISPSNAYVGEPNGASSAIDFRLSRLLLTC